MMFQAVLSNRDHPEYGVATIPFPIPHDQYAHCMELLEALEIGDAVKADCKVEKIDSFYTVLKRTEMLTVNVEELNYLAKRLDSFDTGEAAQFQAMAHKLELFELKDLINLTFCCQQATVITDFSDLAAIGRDHYMNLHGGSAKTEELDALDGEETARRLIESGGGTITPYGVVYDNGMKLEQVYDGRFFPCYYYEPNAITVAVTSKAEPEDTEHITWLFLPMVQEEIDRALLRGGITDPSEIRLSLEDNTSTPEFFNDLGKTLDELKNEHPEGNVIVRPDGFPDSAAICFGASESEYLYCFFGAQSGDAEKAMNEYEDQLECSGFVTTACILFPDMEDEMSFEDFFSLIGVDDYEYLGEDTTAAGWLRFMYNGMEVMVNTNEAASGGGWNFTGAKIVKHNAPVSIVDTEIFNTNQDLADAVMFD